VRTEKPVGDLEQNTRSVAGFRVASTRPAMLQVFEDLQAHSHDGVRAFAPDLSDEPDPAGIVFKLPVVQARSRRTPGYAHRARFVCRLAIITFLTCVWHTLVRHNHSFTLSAKA
jgi:hypothetical protein